MPAMEEDQEERYCDYYNHNYYPFGETKIPKKCTVYKCFLDHSKGFRDPPPSMLSKGSVSL
jgi:hypothetical protein